MFVAEGTGLLKKGQIPKEIYKILNSSRLVIGICRSRQKGETTRNTHGSISSRRSNKSKPSNYPYVFTRRLRQQRGTNQPACNLQAQIRTSAVYAPLYAILLQPACNEIISVEPFVRLDAPNLKDIKLCMIVLIVSDE